MKKILPVLIFCLCGCNVPSEQTDSDPVQEETIANAPFLWENANIYFLLVDRFYNGDSTNDQTLGRGTTPAVGRGFMGGDLAGITQKIRDGYFDDLGISAIWFTPPVEQIHGSTDEGTGETYAYHGYWARDWTAIDPNFGTMEELAELVREAHDHNIRIVMDVVLNHTGPVTPIDSQWPDEWVRTSPACTYVDAESTISCTLVENLPDIHTEYESAVELPAFLVEKWKKEGRYDREMQELDAFFERTGYPRAPKYYLIKWLTDYVRELGIDGFRVDTAKHVEDEVWGILHKEVEQAFAEWRKNNPAAILDNNEFYMVGEVYNYVIAHGRQFPMGGGEYVNFFDDGFKSLINFAFKRDAHKSLDSVYAAYSNVLNNGDLQGKSVLNYIASHDDGEPFDRERNLPMEAGTRLLLAPGAAQIYYGDELARPLMLPGAEGDAHLRSFMNWEDLEGDGKEIFNHWAKLANFRKQHPAVGAGLHETISSEPFVFSRKLEVNGARDEVLIALNAGGSIPVGSLYADGSTLVDAYGEQVYEVKDGVIQVGETRPVILLSEQKIN